MKSYQLPAIALLLFILVAGMLVYWFQASSPDAADNGDRPQVGGTPIPQSIPKGGEPPSLDAAALPPAVSVGVEKLSPSEQAKYAPYSELSRADVHEAFASYYDSKEMDFLTEEMTADVEEAVYNHLNWMLSRDAHFLNEYYKRANARYLERHGPFTQEEALETYALMFSGIKGSNPEDNVIKAVGFTSEPIEIIEGDPSDAISARLPSSIRPSFRRSFRTATDVAGVDPSETVYFHIVTLHRDANDVWHSVSTVWRWDEDHGQLFRSGMIMQPLYDPRIKVPTFYHGKFQ